MENGEQKTCTIDVAEQGDDMIVRPTPWGLPRAALSKTGEMHLTSKKPIYIGSVGLTAFEGYQSVKTDKGIYPVSEDVPVWVKSSNSFITLRQAKADYDGFTLYADAALDDGGQICLIAVS